jgi:hypothetical protein
MNWFYKWFRKKSTKINLVREIPSPSMSNLDLPNYNSMNFSISRADGGHILQYSVYDKKTDRSHQKLFIITDDKDLGEEIGKIISFIRVSS